MFLVPSNKKTLLKNSSASTGFNINHHSAQSQSESHRDNEHEEGISILIIKSVRQSSEILEGAFETLKRWFGVFFRALLEALSPSLKCNRISLEISKEAETNRSLWKKPCCSRNQSVEVKYIQPLAYASAGSLSSAIALSAWKQQQRQQQRKYSTSSVYSGFSDHSCDMDLCRRKVTQRAAALQTDHGLRSSNSCNWTGQTEVPQEHRTSPLESEVVQRNGDAHELRRRELFQLHGHQLRPDGLQTVASDYASDKVVQPYQLEPKLQQQQQQHWQPNELQAGRRAPIKYAANSRNGNSARRSSSIASLMSFHNINNNQTDQQQYQGADERASKRSFGRHQSSSSQEQSRRQSVRANHYNGSIEEVNPSLEEEEQASLVLVSRSALSTLTDQIAFSMNKMKDLEEQVSVIPELKRCLDHVLNDNDPKLAIRNRNLETIPNLNCSDTAAMTKDLRFNNPDTKVNTTNSCNDNDNVLDHINPNNHQRNFNSFTRTNSLNTQLHAIYGAKDSNIAEQSCIVNKNHNIQTARHVSNVLRATQDTANSSSSISSPKVEYEDLISDLISLSYSVNYLPNTSAELSKYTSEETGNLSQVKGLHGNKLDAHKKQQHKKYIASGNSNLAGSTSIIDYQPTSHCDNLIDARLITGRVCSEIKCDPAQSQQEQLSLSPATGCGSMVEKQVQSSCSDVRDTCNQSSRKSLNLKRSSLSGSLTSNNNSRNFQDNMILDPSTNNQTYQQTQQNHSQVLYNSSLQQSRPTISHTRHQHGTGSLSLKTTPVKTALDCGCQSFKEHLRYNSLSREQRLNRAKAQTFNSNSTVTSSVISPQPQPKQKVDASTNTELSMCDIVTKVELNSLMSNIHKTYSTLSTSTVSQANKSNLEKVIFHKPSSLTSENSNSVSTSGLKSSSPLESESYSQNHIASHDSSEVVCESRSSVCSSNRGIVDENEVQKSTFSQDKEAEDQMPDDEEEEDTSASSINSEEPYSLGSSYQDPSDFEEYCAYGESLDRRTKDFMSPSTKIPNDLRFALIRLNDLLKRHRSHEQIESSSCIDVIKKEWFEIAATKNADAVKTKLYVDYFESFTKQLLNKVVNLIDIAGNTAMHYAASHLRLDIIKILLETKICDVNCRNKAGYTPIMLLALADIDNVEEQDTAKRLFSIGDVNIRARASGQTALMLAANHGRVATCKLLLESGADPSLQDYDGSTALMCGSEVGNEEIVRCLLAHRLTDPSTIDNDGLDALTIAMNNGHKNIGLLLYASENVPRMFRSASLRRNSSRIATDFVRKADSLLGSRAARQFNRIECSNL